MDNPQDGQFFKVYVFFKRLLSFQVVVGLLNPIWVDPRVIVVNH